MDESNKSEPNPSAGILWMVLVTTIYFVLKSIMGSVNSKILFTIYLLAVLLGQLTINIGVTKDMCKGTSQIGTAFIATFVPWLLIFGTMEMLLQIFPGWLGPFSNTFGYFFTKSAIKGIMSKLLKAEGNDKDTKEIRKALATIYEDQSLFINEVTTKNYDKWWEKTSTLFEPEFSKKDGTIYNDLLKQINTKESIARYMWYVLTGGLITSASYNYIINTECIRSQESIQQANAKHIKNLSKKAAEEEKQKREYRTYE